MSEIIEEVKNIICRARRDTSKPFKVSKYAKEIDKLYNNVMTSEKDIETDYGFGHDFSYPIIPQCNQCSDNPVNGGIGCANDCKK